MSFNHVIYIPLKASVVYLCLRIGKYNCYASTDV